MSSVTQIGRHQKAVLWTPTGTTDSHGQPVFTDLPCEITVRWESRQRQATDPQGNTIAIEADVFTDRPIPVDSLLWKGRVKDWEAAKENGEVIALMQVATNEETPDLKGRLIGYFVGLVKYRGMPPGGL